MCNIYIYNLEDREQGNNCQAKMELVLDVDLRNSYSYPD